MLDRLMPELLLHPNIPKPLHGLNPRTLKGEEWWNEQRQIAYAKNDYRCWACGIHKKDAKYHNWLEAHEDYNIDYEVGCMTINQIVALCHSCHNYIHNGRLLIVAQRGEIPVSKFWDILEYGNKILSEARLQLNPFAVGVANAGAFSLPGKYPRWVGEIEAPEEDYGYIAEWDTWKLILEGVEYKSRFKNFDEWRKFYSKGQGDAKA